MKQIQAGGKIDKGELIIFNEDTWWEQIRQIGFANYIKLTLEYGNKRTLDQNAYAFATFTKMATRMQQDGWEVTPYMIYKKVETTYCEVEVFHPETGKAVTFIEPLKEKDADEFGEILDTVRENFHKQYPDTYLEEPHEYYGMSLSKYNEWKMGNITRSGAMKDD